MTVFVEPVAKTVDLDVRYAVTSEDSIINARLPQPVNEAIVGHLEVLRRD
jgi:hypothetical protein